MESIAKFLLWLSLLALVVTKVADFVTTIRHVGPNAESNPLARLGFRQLGFRGGLVMVAVLWVLMVAVTYGTVIWFGGVAMRMATATTGFLVAWAQWDAARFNRTGRTTRFTRAVLRGYSAWRKLWRI